MQTEIQALERFFEAINRNDMAAIRADFDPEILRIEPPGFPTSGEYRGVAAVQAQVARGRGSWAEGQCTPERYLARGDKVVVYLNAWVRLHGASDWIGGRFADGFAFRGGRIVHYQTFETRPQALAWAGIDEEPGAA